MARLSGLSGTCIRTCKITHRHLRITGQGSGALRVSKQTDAG